MAKWSGKVFFPTSSQASRAMASGRYPSLPFEYWKPRPERQRIPEARSRLDGVLVMLAYGLRVMSDTRLASLAGVLQNELDRNKERWVQLDVSKIRNAASQIECEQRRRESLLNGFEKLQDRFLLAKSTIDWTREDAAALRDNWADGHTHAENLMPRSLTLRDITVATPRPLPVLLLLDVSG